MKRMFSVFVLAAALVAVPLAGAKAQEDRMAGFAPLHSSHKQTIKPSSLNTEKVMDIQNQLKAHGLYNGEIDGKWGGQTTAALKKYQKNNKLPQSGVLDYKTRQFMSKDKELIDPPGWLL